ncbi:transferase [Streptomyces bambusae]|uniref:transferase n=1 Tax=Streptomyces bambusae TaxID=1550616 RepID=UPI001CFD2DC1|nr:transferase [Streptomyces bambusae]MCB5165677.1 transferase [Streptomyces bambusae]
MPESIRIGDYVHAPATSGLEATGYAKPGEFELSDFLTRWDVLHNDALQVLPERIHPTAQIHPTAIIGDDVIIGPGVRVHEFSTVRKQSVLAAGVSIGFGCEVTHSFVGENTVLGHQVGIGHSIIGTNAHLSANLVIAAISLWNYDMRTPVKEIVLHGPGDEPPYRCATPRFGGLIGDHVQTGSMITLGPGIAVGRHSTIAASVCMGSSIVPADSVVRSSTPKLVIERRRI